MDEPARIGRLLGMDVPALERVLREEESGVPADGGDDLRLGGKVAREQLDLAAGVADRPLVSRLRIERAQERIHLDADDVRPEAREQTQVADAAVPEVGDP